ncbi:MAG: ribonuclease J [Oligoflexales bacterium]|nr:ribonuclease J [Oligoflexales bacterium]
MGLKKELNQNKLHVIPFGGCGEFGMNMTAYIIKSKLFLVDAGTMFPDPRKLGVSAIIPQAHGLIKDFGGIEAYFITHGHEDHIGSLPYFYQEWPAPIYATPWTVELIKRKFSERGIPTKDIHLVKAGQLVKAPPLKVRYVHVNHSIPDACALFISTHGNKHKVFHTGDFKIDPTPVGTKPINLKELKGIGSERVDLLIADSTNAMSTGPSPSEKSVIKPLEKHMLAAKGRVFITTFASNLWRLKVIVDLCKKHKKKLAVIGRGMINCLELGSELGYVSWPKSVMIDIEDCDNVPDKDLVVLVSGSQGEFRSGLPSIANDEHRNISLKKGDLVIFSARVIPGNEKPILSLCDQLRRKGAKIITAREHKDIHVSGHAYKKDLEVFLNLLKPAHYLPVHGTYTHLLVNSQIGKKMQYKPSERSLIDNGDILQVNGADTKIIGQCEIDCDFVDQDTQTPMPWEILRERLKIGELGLALLTGVFCLEEIDFISGPELEIQGLMLPKGVSSKRWHKDVKRKVQRHLEKWLESHPLEQEDFAEQARIQVRKALFNTFNKKPVTLVKFHFI